MRALASLNFPGLRQIIAGEDLSHAFRPGASLQTPGIEVKSVRETWRECKATQGQIWTVLSGGKPATF